MSLKSRQPVITEDNTLNVRLSSKLYCLQQGIFTILLLNYILKLATTLYQLRGHPFMTSTRRGFRLRWTHVDGGSSPMWTSCLLLMQRSWSCFTRISSLDGI